MSIQQITDTVLNQKFKLEALIKALEPFEECGNEITGIIIFLNDIVAQIDGVHTALDLMIPREAIAQ